MSNILFVTHTTKQCGVYEFGKNVYDAIKQSQKYNYTYLECDNFDELDNYVKETPPDAIIYNFHPATMPWILGLSEYEILESRISKYSIPQIGIIHEIYQDLADKAIKRMGYVFHPSLLLNSLFDYYIAADPTLLLKNELVFKTGRPLFEYNHTHTQNKIPVFCSASLATDNKGFEKIVEYVQNEYDEAEIRLNIPEADFGRKGLKDEIRERCLSLIYKPGIKAIITHEYFSTEEYLNFMAQATANFFLYESSESRGVSSVIDSALSVKKPIVISDCDMFRHVLDANPSVCLYKSSIREIVSNGFKPLEKYTKEWTPQNLSWDYERILEKIIPQYIPEPITMESSMCRLKEFIAVQKTGSLSNNWLRTTERLYDDDYKAVTPDVEYKVIDLPSNTSLCKVLDDNTREIYKPAIDKLFELIPNTMSKKIPRANINQGFVFDTVNRFIHKYTSPKILCVGSYEDTACMALIKMGYEIEEIDPMINYDLQTFFTKPSTIRESYDIIFSTSVIEHDPDDRSFLECISNLLKENGVVIITCDYKEGWADKGVKPSCNARFYTKADFTDRFMSCLKGCELIGKPDYDGYDNDFVYESIYRYNFASFVARKVKT